MRQNTKISEIYYFENTRHSPADYPGRSEVVSGEQVG